VALQAQTSKAQVIGLANGGDDTVNAIKQAAEFGITRGGQKLAGLVIVISIVHGLGLETARGLVFTESFYWDIVADWALPVGRARTEGEPTCARLTIVDLHLLIAGQSKAT
jgi:branched-chain amino acid transport system substrate-binding protein